MYTHPSPMAQQLATFERTSIPWRVGAEPPAGAAPELVAWGRAEYWDGWRWGVVAGAGAMAVAVTVGAYLLRGKVIL